jgi:hypothetical protein
MDLGGQLALPGIHQLVECRTPRRLAKVLQASLLCRHSLAKRIRSLVGETLAGLYL